MLFFPGALGILELEHQVEPRSFYVYPELVRLGSLVDRLAEGGGEERAASGGGSPDPTVIEGLRPLANGRPAGRIAWKRWAATGVPCEPMEGRSSAYGLRVVLDLRPPLAEGQDRLAAEDLAVSAPIPCLRAWWTRAFPRNSYSAGRRRAGRSRIAPHSMRAYATSTSVLFTDDRFPLAAFSEGRASLLVSTRPIAESESAGGPDLFASLETAIARGRPVSVLAVPPPSRADREHACAVAALERLCGDGRRAPLVVLDPRRGTEDLVHAFLG
jgi:hypothetical protein